jgi:hypothetical protein
LAAEEWMTEERRYRDDEIGAIFEAAANAPAVPGGHAPVAAQGLTLAELQEIGREVGVSPERIAASARALDHAPVAVPNRSIAGVPISAGRMVALARAPTDEEWELLVVELRETFGARGRITTQGRLREWRNGNLHACVEPTAGGWQLRLGTRKGSAPAAAGIGAGATVLGGAIALGTLLTGAGAAEMLGPGLIWLGGVGTLAYNAVRLPRWAGTRARQMEHIAERARTIIGAAD